MENVQEFNTKAMIKQGQIIDEILKLIYVKPSGKEQYKCIKVVSSLAFT